MDVISWLYHSIDAGIIRFYRLPENPLIGFYFGTTVLVWICILTGEALLTRPSTVPTSCCHISSVYFCLRFMFLSPRGGAVVGTRDII